MNIENNDAFQLSKKYYEQLDSSIINELTKERWEEITNFAKLYAGLTLSPNLNHFYPLKEKFNISLQKLISLKDNKLKLTKQQSKRYNSKSHEMEIELTNDGEKILFIQTVVDPDKIILKHWLGVKEKTINKSNELPSASDFLKAKKIMESYYDGFFLYKFFNDSEMLQNYSLELNDQNKKNR